MTQHNATCKEQRWKKTLNPTPKKLSVTTKTTMNKNAFQFYVNPSLADRCEQTTENIIFPTPLWAITTIHASNNPLPLKKYKK